MGSGGGRCGAPHTAEGDREGGGCLPCLLPRWKVWWAQQVPWGQDELRQI